MYKLKSGPRGTSDLKEKEPRRFAALREQLLAHAAAIDADGPDWWKRLSPSGGTVKNAAAGKNGGKKKGPKNE